MSFTLGNLPERVHGFQGDALDNYFRVARGRSAQGTEEHALLRRRCSRRDDQVVRHQLPLHRARSSAPRPTFKLDASRLLEQLAEASAQGVKAKPVIIGPVTYLALGKAKDESGQAGAAAAPAARVCGSCSTRWRAKAWNGCRSTSRSW